eukprot:TRINITY_DN7573_c0_g1_i2.p1 TRINITY_DN7573_c0_g1~~TRINITY_DN7573_c0_g1_i2.p1  ORF type:complete len:236 (-),score=49.78 TRINITY_DN7573_c0_g1_i2:641-1348(-)
MIWSRAFWFDDNRTIPCIVPFADMINHPNTAYQQQVDGFSSYRFDPKDRTFKLTASTFFEKGKQVYTSYGERSNTEFLREYGMILLKNPWDSFALTFPDTFMSSIPRRAERERLLQDKGMPHRTFTIEADDLPEELLSALRLYSLEEHEVKREQELVLAQPFDSQNEVKAVAALISLLEQQLQRIGSSVKDDTALLDANTLSYHAELAVWYRRSTIKLISKLLSQIQQFYEALTS